MHPIEIKFVQLGFSPPNFNLDKIRKWKSDIFRLYDGIDSIDLRGDSNGPNWEYLDESLDKKVPSKNEADFLLAIVSVPLQDNWYTRRLKNDRIVFSFYQIAEILSAYNVPLENVIYRLLYASSLVYLRQGNKIPSADEITNFTHDETRGCLFDMNGVKHDIIHSCHNPKICDECVDRLKTQGVPREVINKAQKEIKKIRKSVYYRASDFVKNHPFWSLIISLLAALFVGIASSIIGAAIFEHVITQ